MGCKRIIATVYFHQPKGTCNSEQSILCIELHLSTIPDNTCFKMPEHSVFGRGLQPSLGLPLKAIAACTRTHGAVPMEAQILLVSQIKGIAESYIPAVHTQLTIAIAISLDYNFFHTDKGTITIITASIQIFCYACPRHYGSNYLTSIKE